MEPVFSIWWVIAIGALAFFVFMSLMQQRAVTAEENAGTPELGQSDEPVPEREHLMLVQLQEFPKAEDQASRIRPMGITESSIQDVRFFEAAEDTPLAAMPAAVRMHLESAYDAGTVYGLRLPSLLKGGALKAGERIFFALVYRGDEAELLAYS